jgi:predicted dehydrogenase
VKPGLLGKIGMAEVYCYYHMRTRENPQDTKPPEHLDYEAWTGPAPMRPYNKLVHPRSWRAFMEYGNGIVGDMCIHMLDMVRWMFGLGWPRQVSSTGGILVQKESKANISDTQTATFDFPEFPVVWNHRTYGDPADKDYPWGATVYGEKGTLKLSVHKYEFFPSGQAKPKLSGSALFEYEKYPEDKSEKDLERHVASAIREHMRDFLKARESRGKPVADIEQGHISTASCILANLSMQLGRSLSWDPAKHQIVHDDEANKLLKRPYRAGYEHPAG